MTLDELLATSPLPWTSLKGIAFDCNGTIVPTSWGIVPNDMNALLVEAVNRIGELQAERDEIRRERDGFEGMLAPKVCSYGGDDTEYFDRVVANHPLPWTGSIDGMIKDSAGGGFAIFCSEFMRLFLPAINSIVSLRAERDSLKFKVEELEHWLHIGFNASELRDRAISCVNACRGIPNPEEVVPLMIRYFRAYAGWVQREESPVGLEILAVLQPKREG